MCAVALPMATIGTAPGGGISGAFGGKPEDYIGTPPEGGTGLCTPKDPHRMGRATPPKGEPASTAASVSPSK